jgi:hypothetical protein
MNAVCQTLSDCLALPHLMPLLRMREDCLGACVYRARLLSVGVECVHSGAA